MHIGFVAPEYPPTRSANGIATYTGIMVEEVVRRGHRASVFCQAIETPASQGIKPGVRANHVRPAVIETPLVKIAWYRIFGSLFHGYVYGRDHGVALRRSVQSVHEDDPIDVIECPEVRGFSNWLFRLEIPVVVRLHAAVAVTWLHGKASLDHRYRSIASLERKALARTGFCSAPSRAVVEETTRILDVNISHAKVIPNPCPPGQLPDREGTMSSARKVLFVGSVTHLKGFDTAIQAFAKIAGQDQYHDVVLDVVGADRGGKEAGNWSTFAEECLRESVPNADVLSRIHFLGRRSADEVQDLRRTTFITIVPSRYENFPNTVVEAMAAGSALVAARAGGIPEIVEHERNGLLFQVGDAEDLARQIIRLLDDFELCQRLGRQARQDVQAKFSPQVVGDRMEAYYHEVVERWQCDRNDRRGRKPLGASSLEPSRVVHKSR